MSAQGAAFDGLVIETGAAPEAAVIWMHGLGADAHDFKDLVPLLRVPVPTRFIFPNAPVQPVTINGGMRMRAWYDILQMSLERQVDEAGIRESAARIDALIEAQIAAGIPAERIVVAGFSQGGAMALTVGLRFTQRLAGIVVLSAYDPLPKRLDEAHAANAGLPIFFGHGLFDMVVPIAAGRAASERLSAAGYAANFRSYPTQHSVHPDEVRDLAAWFQQRLGG